MRKFLSLLVLFLLPGFIFAYLLDRFVSKNLAKSNKEAVGEYQVWNDIYEGKASSDIVIYGSSRAWVHFDPLIIGDSLKMSAYNLGIDGHGFWLQYLRHLEYSKYNRRPKLTVLSVDILTLQKRKELYNYSQFLPYALYNKNVRDFTSSFQGFSMPDFYFPLLRFTRLKGSVQTAFGIAQNGDSTEPLRVKGYRGKNEEWNDDFEKAKASQLFYSVIVDTPTLVLFDKFLKEMKTEKMPLVLVYAPEHIQGQQFVKNRAEIVSVFAEHARKYQIPFINYSSDTLSFNKKYFYNALHLNLRGATIFSQHFAGDLKKLGIVK